MAVVDQFSSFIKQHALFHPEERILLAVSGGRDSVLMVHLFKSAGFNFGIAHCNFNMRAEDSDLDEQFTSDLAAKLNVPYFAITFNTEEYSKQNHISIQMAARELRYNWLEKIRTDFSFDYIAVAHHQNDTVETMLLNLTRGTGISGMHGILPKKGKILRPLLFLNRGEIDEMIKENGYSYRDDLSNLSSKYARNKIRIKVIPSLKELNPALENTFEANRKRFAELEILLEKYLEELKARIFKKTASDEYRIDLKDLKDLEPMDTLLYGLFNPYGFSEAVLQDLKRSWDGSPGKVFSSPGYDLNLDRGAVILSRRQFSAPEDVTITEESDSVSWNGQKFRISLVQADQVDINKSNLVAQADFDLIRFPLTLRLWKSGDYFQPLGMHGKKKLSDFLIGQKIPLNRKKEIGILENKNSDIIWVAGLRLDNRYKITPNTKKVFIFEQYI